MPESEIWKDVVGCKGIYRSPNGKLIGGGNLYRDHRWFYE